MSFSSAAHNDHLDPDRHIHASEMCEVCGKDIDDCICPECPHCGSQGNPECYSLHTCGLVRSPEQLDSLAETVRTHGEAVQAFNQGVASSREDAGQYKALPATSIPAPPCSPKGGVSAAELISLLAQYPPSTRVVLRGYEGGFSDIGKPVLLSLDLNRLSSWFYGPHEYADGATTNPVQALLLDPRANPLSDGHAY